MYTWNKLHGRLVWTVFTRSFQWWYALEPSKCRRTDLQSWYLKPQVGMITWFANQDPVVFVGSGSLFCKKGWSGYGLSILHKYINFIDFVKIRLRVNFITSDSDSGCFYASRIRFWTLDVRISTYDTKNIGHRNIGLNLVNWSKNPINSNNICLFHVYRILILKKAGSGSGLLI